MKNLIFLVFITSSLGFLFSCKDNFERERLRTEVDLTFDDYLSWAQSCFSEAEGHRYFSIEQSDSVLFVWGPEIVSGFWKTKDVKSEVFFVSLTPDDIFFFQETPRSDGKFEQFVSRDRNAIYTVINILLESGGCTKNTRQKRKF